MSDYGVRVIISGKVQGVAYRAWASSKAEEMALNGWIRNLSDGTVEAVFAGDESTVEHMVEECGVGPRSARVDDIERFELDDDELNDVDEGFYTRTSAEGE